MHHPRFILSFLEREQGKSALSLLLLRSRGRLVALAPFYVRQAHWSLRFSVLRLVNLRARVLKCFGDQFAFARSVTPGEVVRAAFAELSKKAADFDYLSLEEVILPSPLVDAFPDGNPFSGFRLFPLRREEKAHVHALFESFEAYEKSIGSKRRNDMRRNSRAYRNQDGTILGRLDRITSPEQVGTFLDDVNRIYHNAWQSRITGHGPRNRSAEQQFYRAMARAGWLRCYLLRNLDGEAVAFVTGFQYRDRLTLEDIGYDLAARDTHPGVAMMYFMLRDLYRGANKPSILDLGYGDSRYKAALATDSRRARAYAVVRRPLFRALMSAQHVADSVETRVRQRIHAAGWETRVRGWLKRGSAGGSKDSPTG
jgi:hypothetical protein